jgi:hypothetical protein
MKNLIILLSCTLVPVFLSGQGFKIVALTANGIRADSVSLGFSDNASIGIDPQLGEVDISNQMPRTVDIRVVQRDSIGFSCTYTFSPDHIDTFKYYFPVKFDSKINLRSRRDTSFINRIFEVKFLTKNVKTILFYPLIQNQSPNNFNNNDWLFVDSCLNKINLASFSIDPRDPTASAPMTASSYISNLIFVFRPSFLSNSKEVTNTKIRVYPNPFSDIVIVENIDIGKVKEVRLYDILGGVVLQQKIVGYQSLELHLSYLNRGTYLLVLYDDTGKQFFNKTIVK